MLPAPVDLKVLQLHFKETYGFNPIQVNTMVESSSNSLDQVFTSIREVREAGGTLSQMAEVFHGLKGLLLNMGQKEWAAYVQDIEQKLKEGAPCDIDRIVKELHAGLAEVVCYYRK